MSKCFGHLYDTVARECQMLCDVHKECKMVMEGRVMDSKGLPCFGTYEEENWACTSACHKKDECKVETEKLSNMSEEERKEVIATHGTSEEPIEKEAVVSGANIVKDTTIEELKKTVEKLVEKEEALAAGMEETEEVVEEITSSTSSAASRIDSVEPAPVQPVVRVPSKSKTVNSVKKPVKKHIVKDLMFSASGAMLNEMLEAIFASGADEDTPENRKKNTTLINSWCSEFKSKGMKIERKGDLYVGSGN